MGECTLRARLEDARAAYRSVAADYREAAAAAAQGALSRFPGASTEHISGSKRLLKHCISFIKYLLDRSRATTWPSPGVDFFAVRALLALIPALSVNFAILRPLLGAGSTGRRNTDAIESSTEAQAMIATLVLWIYWAVIAAAQT